MLYFSKLRIISVFLFTLVISYFALSNFTKIDDDYFNRNINLGLDLQGGSYLLLEIDNKPVITQKLQTKVIEIKNFFKKKNLIVKDFIVDTEKLSFNVNVSDIDSIQKLLEEDNSEINPYFQKYKSHEFDIIVNENNFSITLSFNNIKTNLKIDYDAIISFADPEANFGLILKNKQLKKEDNKNIKDKLVNKDNVINFSNFKKN